MTEKTAEKVAEKCGDCGKGLAGMYFANVIRKEKYCVNCFEQQQATRRKGIDPFASPDMGGDIDELMEKCVRKKHSIILDGHYRIELERCDTPEKILDWVSQLCDKGWITPVMIGQFVCTACAAIHLDYRGKA